MARMTALIPTCAVGVRGMSVGVKAGNQNKSAISKPPNAGRPSTRIRRATTSMSVLRDTVSSSIKVGRRTRNGGPGLARPWVSGEHDRGDVGIAVG